MSKTALYVLTRPDSEHELIAHADRLLRAAGAVGTLPTPIDDLYQAARITNEVEAEAAKERFFARLSKQGREVFLSLWQKLRGIADLRDRVVYIPKGVPAPRELFVKAHELGHEVIPWHQVDPTYTDDDVSLRPDTQDLFEREASFFAAEVIFQGKRFTHQSRDYRPSLDAVFTLAEEYGASRHSTLRRFVEEHDEPLAAVPYWPSQYTVDEYGNPLLRKGNLVASLSFCDKYATIQLPEVIRTGHSWVAARDLSQSCEGHIRLDYGGGSGTFEWYTWWNQYSLLVLLRCMPPLRLVGNLIRSAHIQL